MVNDSSFAEASKHRKDMGALLLRGTIALNFLLFVLSWCPWFLGSEKHWSVSDQLFGSYRFAGFRADFVWMIASTIYIFFAALFFLFQARTDPSVRLNLGLCMAEVLGFCLFIYGSLTFSFLN